MGYFWHIVELKKPTSQFAGKSRGYSRDGQLAISQCNQYLSHFNDYIDNVRAGIRIPDLIQPEGVIILIGDSETESDVQRRTRAEFVRNTPKIEVVSYRRIVNGLKNDLAATGRVRSPPVEVTLGEQS
jgi:hypothetical protein